MVDRQSSSLPIIRGFLAIAFAGVPFGLGMPHALAQSKQAEAANASVRKIAWEREYDSHHVFNGKGLVTSTHRVVTHVKLASAVQAMGQYRIANNTYFHDLEIVEAATLKANGERRLVEPGKIMTMTGSQSGSALFNADTQTGVIPFPDLAAGDRTLVVYRRTQKRHTVPGIVSHRWLMPPTPHVRQIKLTVDVPDGLGLRFAERDVVRENATIANGQRYTWVMRGPEKRSQPERLAVSWVDYAPGVMVSNLKDWNAFGKKYSAMLGDVTEPDEVTRAKAEEITRGLNDPEQIARALFNWTSRNIRYFRVMLGNGGWRPHACGAILKAAYGDCKDHAALLKAFLAAKGIESELVIINQSRVYRDYPVPLTAFDHMILYVPAFNRYLDATASTSSFDALPLSLQGKPALHIRKDGAEMLRTPVMPAKTAKVEFTATATIGRDGRIVGRSDVHASGVAEQLLRSDARRIESLGPSEAAKYYLGRTNLTGSGRMDAPEPLAQVTPFVIRARFEHGSGGSLDEGVTIATGPKVYNPPVNTLFNGIRNRWRHDFACTPLTYVEKLSLSWPQELKLRKKPRNIRVVSDFARYRATYTLAGASLQVERILVIEPPQVPCRPADLNLAARVFAAARFDRRQKLAFDGASRFDEAFDDPSTGKGP